MNRSVRASRLLLLLLPLFPFACSRDAGRELLSSGHIEATEVRIASKVPGRVRTLTAQEGDKIEAGAVLAEIDTTDLHLALEAALADRAQAEAELRLRRAGARREDIAEARAMLQQATADLDNAAKDLTRVETLVASGSGTEKQRDDAATRRDLARGRRDAAADRLERLQNGSRAEEIDAAEARVSAGPARAAQIRQPIADARVASPTAGRVTERMAEPGEIVGIGTPLLMVTDLGSPWLTIYVGEPDLPRLRLGQSVEVVADGGQKRAGKISFIASEAEFTPRNVQTRDERVKLVFKVKVALENADELWKPGMPAEARLALEGGKG
ncbi:MAG: efflux RND transporter periplasmic adaptor subunit [Candidatus Eisenbacteria bacterium]